MDILGRFYLVNGTEGHASDNVQRLADDMGVPMIQLRSTRRLTPARPAT